MGRKLIHVYTDDEIACGCLRLLDLYAWFKRSTTERMFEEARLWYVISLADIKTILYKSKADVSLIQACGIVSALSVANSWYGTLEDLENTLEWYKQPNGREYPHSKTYKQQVKKAVAILDLGSEAESSDILEILGGLKTKAFFLSLLGLDDIVIDRHIIRAFTGVYTSHPSVSKQQYHQISEAIQLVTHILNENAETELLVSEVQAILWCAHLFKTQNRGMVMEVDNV